MENKKTPETLEEGFMLSKLSQIEIPCNEILEQGNPACLNGLNENFAADFCSPESEINHVEFIGNGSVVESMAFDGVGGNNLMNKGCSNSYTEDTLSMFSFDNDASCKDVGVLEGSLECSGNVRVGIGKLDEPFDKRSDPLHSHAIERVDGGAKKGEQMPHPHENDSPSELEVSGRCINLFVEVFGPLNEDSENIDNVDDFREGECKLEESESDQEYSFDENGTVSPGFKDENSKIEREDIVGSHEWPYSSGDLVWVKTRTQQSWWPGMISGSPNVVNDAAKGEKRISFLVKYYGSPCFVWCDPSCLKPFVEYFEQMSRQKSTSRTFYASVEKALCDIGQRVKSRMTCPCFTKESQTPDGQLSMGNKEENSVSAGVGSKSDFLSVSLFEPMTLYARINHLARSVYAPGQVELMVLKNRLSSFYCSVGHCDMPLQLLRSEDVDEDSNNLSRDGKKSVKVRNGDDVGRRRRKRRSRSVNGDLLLDDGTASPAKGWESRERKKSKYLSYPYVNVNQEANASSTVEREKEDPECPPSSLNTKTTPPPSCNGTKTRKKWTKKILVERHKISKADDIDACSSELLAELCSTARDCVFLSRSKYSDSLKIFYRSFRAFSFLDVDIAHEKLLQISAKGVKKEKVKGEKKSKDKSVSLPSVEASVENVEGCKSPNTDNPVEKVKKKRGRKKKEQVPLPQNPQIRVVREVEIQRVNNASSGGTVENVVGDKQTTDNPQAKENSVCSKDKQMKEQVISSGIQNSYIMGANGFYNGSAGMISFQHVPCNVLKSGITTKMGEGVVPGVVHANSVAKDPDLNGNYPSFSFGPNPVGADQMKGGFLSPNVSVVNQMILQNTPQSSNSVISPPNQCQSEEVTARESGSNVTNTGLSALSHYAMKMGIFVSGGKPEPKKRKRREKNAQAAAAIPDLNGSVLDMSSSANTMPDGTPISPESAPPKRMRCKTDIGPSGEVIGGNLLLTFAPESTLPSKETLVATFSRFGLLKETELQFLSDSSVQIVYERRSDALFACRSLEKGHSFGDSLVGFKTDCVPPPPPSSVKKRKDVQMLRSFAMSNGSKKATTEAPDICVIKQNVEMMKSTLEKAGSNLSAEVRAKLENEIKAFLDKINSMAAGSSAS